MQVSQCVETVLSHIEVVRVRVRKKFNFSSGMRRMSCELVGWLHNLSFFAPIQYLNSIGFITVIYTVMTVAISVALA